MQQAAQRPTGVTILAVLAIIVGILAILGSLLILLAGGVASTQDAGLGALVIVLGILSLAIGVLELAFGIGAWTLKPWAWTLGVASQVIALVLDVLNIVTGSSIASQALGIVISAAILYYLFTPGVKRAFGRS